MTRRAKSWIGAAALLAILGLAGAVVASRRNGDTVEIDAEVLRQRPLVALVTASGEVQPQRSVDVHANVNGRVERVAVKEGQQVQEGDLLLQIDPVSAEAASEAQAAQVLSLRSERDALLVDLEQARRDFERARELATRDLISREELQRAENAVTRIQSQIRGVEARIAQANAMLRGTRHDLAQVTIRSPMSGVVSQLAVEEGELAFTGLNPTLLVTIADLGAVEAEVKVDETDVVNVKIGQPATVTIDAFPDTTFQGEVTEVGTSPIPVPEGQPTEDAKDFKVVVALQDPLPEARAGLSATADVETARRPSAVALPIQALVVREVPRPRLREAPPDTVEPGEETEGVFVIRNGVAHFVPVEVGIAGERYFEVAAGVQAGDSVVTGTYEVLRELEDGDPVRPRKEEEGERRRRPSRQDEEDDE